MSGAAWLVRRASCRFLRLVLVLLLLAGAGHLAWQAVLANGPYAADHRNPYNYAQTSRDLLRLVQQVEALAQVHPQGRQMLVKVMTSEGDCWPLPWYLRNLKPVGWWDHVPADPYAPVMVVSAQFHAALDEKGTHVMAGYFELRPRVFLELYVDLELWRAYLARTRPSATDAVRALGPRTAGPGAPASLPASGDQGNTPAGTPLLLVAAGAPSLQRGLRRLTSAATGEGAMRTNCAAGPLCRCASAP